jgi:hypothetical protein
MNGWSEGGPIKNPAGPGLGGAEGGGEGEGGRVQAWGLASAFFLSLK